MLWPVTLRLLTPCRDLQQRLPAHCTLSSGKGACLPCSDQRPEACKLCAMLLWHALHATTLQITFLLSGQYAVIADVYHTLLRLHTQCCSCHMSRSMAYLSADARIHETVLVFEPTALFFGPAALVFGSCSSNLRRSALNATAAAVCQI